MGPGQAAAVARAARQLHVTFLNVADASQSLRAQCSPYVFHVAASSRMYMGALAAWSIASKHRRWFVVAQDPGAGAAVRRARKALANAGGGVVVGSTELPAGTSAYYRVFDEIDKASPDLVVLAMDPEQQGLFLSQLPRTDPGWAVSGPLPTYAQDRYAFFQLTQDDPGPIAHVRPVMWDAALTSPAATRLAQAFGGQTGSAIDAGAWSTYTAIQIVADASKATGAADPTSIEAYLNVPAHTFRLAKGVPLSFRPWDHQLRQPLYIAKLDGTAPWGTAPETQTALASVVATVPSGLGPGTDSRKLLDSLGEPPHGATTCQTHQADARPSTP